MAISQNRSISTESRGGRRGAHPGNIGRYWEILGYLVGLKMKVEVEVLQTTVQCHIIHFHACMHRKYNIRIRYK